MLLFLHIESQIKDAVVDACAPLQKITPLSKVVSAVIFITLPFLGFFIGTQQDTKSALTTSDTRISDAVPSAKTTLSSIKEISPDAYLINNELFYSDALNLVVTGYVESITQTETGFSFCDDPSCSDYITFLPINDASLSPDNYVKSLAQDVGANLDACTVELVNSSAFSSELVVQVSDPITVTDKDLFDNRLTLHPGQTFETLADYKAYCKDNPECNWDTDMTVAQKENQLCSKYSDTTIFGGRKSILVNTDASGIIKNALFVNNESGNGDQPPFSSVMFVNPQ